MMIPVMIISLQVSACQRVEYKVPQMVAWANHCQASSTSLWIWSVPYATKPSKMIAAPFMRTSKQVSLCKLPAVGGSEETYTSTRRVVSAPGACRTWT